MSDPNLVEVPQPDFQSDSNIISDKTFEEVVQEVINGEWSQGQDQRKRLAAAGFKPNEVRKAVNRLRNNR